MTLYPATIRFLTIWSGKKAAEGDEGEPAPKKKRAAPKSGDKKKAKKVSLSDYLDVIN